MGGVFRGRERRGPSMSVLELSSRLEDEGGSLDERRSLRRESDAESQGILIPPSGLQLLCAMKAVFRPRNSLQSHSWNAMPAGGAKAIGPAGDSP